MEKNKTIICYCCRKEFKEDEITKIPATSSDKCRDGTDAEDRFVCEKCNHLKEKK